MWPKTVFVRGIKVQLDNMEELKELVEAFGGENTEIIAGEVIEGKVVEKKKFKIFRDKVFIGEGKIDELQQNRIEASEVGAGKEFGLKVLTKKPILAGDILEVFDEQVKKREMPAR